MDLGDFVQLAGGASALIAAIGWAARQVGESVALLAKARAAKLTAEAALAGAGAKALEDALERVDRLEERVEALEASEVRCRQELDMERRARITAEGRLAELEQAIEG
jgi:hypothetical protein